MGRPCRATSAQDQSLGLFIEQQLWAQQTDCAILTGGISTIIPVKEKAQNQLQVVEAKRDAQHAGTAGLGRTVAGPYR